MTDETGTDIATTKPEVGGPGGAVGPPAEKHYDRFRAALVERRDEFAAALGKTVDPDIFIEVCVTAYLANTDLQRADQVSLYGALRKAAQLGLRPDGEEGYVEVWKDSKTGRRLATFNPMYKGLIRTLTRGGQVLMVDPQVVRSGDEFDYRLGDDPYVRHVPQKDPAKRGEITYCYAIFHLANGLKLREVMSREEMDAIRENAKGRRREGPAWRTNPDQMYRKMPIRRGSKFLDLNPRQAAVFEYDDALDSGTSVVEPGDRIPEAEWRTLDQRAQDHADRQRDDLRAAMRRQSENDGDPLDRLVDFGKHADGSTTWRALVSENAGYGYVKYAILPYSAADSLAADLRAALEEIVAAGAPNPTKEQMDATYDAASGFAAKLAEAGRPLTHEETDELDLLRHDDAFDGLLELKEDWRARLEAVLDESGDGEPELGL